MPMKIDFNFRKVEAKITQYGERAEKGMSNVMRKRAVMIRDLARSFAPRKTGLLEKNIDYVTVKDSNRRNSYEVYIDQDAERKRGTLGDYALVMERRLRPHGRGPFNLGEISKEKRQAGNDVGGRFFKRAVEKGTELLKQELQAAAKGMAFTGVSTTVQKKPFAQATNALNRSKNRKRKNKQ